PPAPEVAVADLGAEGVDRPLRRVGRHHVEVVEQAQGVGRVAAPAPEAGDEVAPARGALQDRRLVAGVAQDAGQELGRRRLVPRGVGRVEPEVLPGDLDRLVAELGPVHQRASPRSAARAASEVWGRAPVWLMTSAAARAPRRRQPASGRPRAMPSRNPAAKRSPAPVVSSTWGTGSAATLTVSVPSEASAPAAPRV